MVECDNQMAYLHGYGSPSELAGQKMNSLIPGFVLPPSNRAIPKVGTSFASRSVSVLERCTHSTISSQDVKKQRATGKTKTGNPFPLSVLVQPVPKVDDKGQPPTTDKLQQSLKSKSSKS